MSYQFKLYHKVFNYQLSASSLFVYTGILNHANRLGYAYVKAETLAKLTGLSSKTVLRAAAQLQACGLITITQRHGMGGRRSYNGYTVTPLTGGFTLLPNDIFRCHLSKSAFCTYLYLRKCAGNGVNKNKAWPSLAKMANVLGMTIKTIIAAVTELVSRKLLGKNRCIKTDGSYGHNQYYLKNILAAIQYIVTPLFPSFGQSGKKKTRLCERVWAFVSTTTQKIYQVAINILHKLAKCKPFQHVGL